MDPNKRPDDMVRITTPELAQAFIEEQVAAIREQIGDKKVLLALSGGVDSSVVAALLIKAIGKQLICVHVNHGLMRKGESEQVVDVFRTRWTPTWSMLTRLIASWISSWTSRSPRPSVRLSARVHSRVRGGGPQGWRRG